MTRVLIVDPDASLTSSVVRCLREVGVDAEGHTHIDVARDWHARPFDLVLVDLSQVSVLHAFVDTCVVVMVAYPDPPQERELAQRYPLLRKPFTSAELLSLLQQELGSLGLPPASLLQALQAAHAAKKSACLVLEDTVEPAEIYVIDGEIYDARRGPLRGEAALRALLEQPVALRAAPTIEICSRTIHRGFRSMILDLLTQIDDAERGAPPRPHRSEEDPL